MWIHVDTIASWAWRSQAGHFAGEAGKGTRSTQRARKPGEKCSLLFIDVVGRRSTIAGGSAFGVSPARLSATNKRCSRSTESRNTCRIRQRGGFAMLTARIRAGGGAGRKILQQQNYVEVSKVTRPARLTESALRADATHARKTSWL